MKNNALMKKQFSLLKLLFLFLFVVLYTSNSQSQNLQLDTLDQYIQHIMTEVEVPGMSVAIVKDGQIVYNKAFGNKTKDKNDPVDRNTLFGIGSISKSITALSLGILVDEGKLNWDDKVKDHLPYFELYDPYVTSTFSIRDLLTHRSGLKPVSGGLLWYGSDLNREEVIRKMKYLRPVSEFRGSPAYQNLTFVVAGEIVSTLTGQPWDEFIRNRIFKPLRMEHTKSLYRDIVGTANISTPHTKTPRYEVIAIEHRNHDNLGPAGAIYSTAEDMAQYMKLILNQGIFEGDTIVKPETMKEILTPQTIFPIYGKPIHNEFTSYGFGWWLTPKDGHKIVEHSGGVDGMVAHVQMILDKEFGIVVLSNAEEMAAGAVALNMIGNVLNTPEDYKTYEVRRLASRRSRKANAEKRLQELQASRIKGTEAPSPEKLIGTYHEKMYGEISVRNADQGGLELTFSRTPSFTGKLAHWNYNTYRIDWYDPMVPNGFVTFILDPEGKVKEMRLDQPRMLDVDFSELGEINKVE